MDLCHSRYRIFGKVNLTLLKRIEETLRDFIDNSDVMNILRERIRVALSLSIKNDCATEIELFSIGNICEIKGTKVYILNTKTGNLYYRNIKT